MVDRAGRDARASCRAQEGFEGERVEQLLVGWGSGNKQVWARWTPACKKCATARHLSTLMFAMSLARGTTLGAG
eukprot:7651307-Alexandrium_andersonii.AAC.1